MFSISRVIVLWLLLVGLCSGATYTSTQDGNWNTDATWGGGGHPTSNDDIAVIGHDVTYDAGTSAITRGNVTINSGGMLVFPTNASSTMKFNATAILTVNSGGELRTGTTSAVGSVGAAYTLSIEWNKGSSRRNVLILQDGAVVNIHGADVTRYAHLDSDWTSGQSFYVEGDYSSEWVVGQLFYIHINDEYVTNGHQTQGKIYTIASVGAYDSGNDRTQITISESAPGITFTALFQEHRSTLILLSRNVFLGDISTPTTVYGYVTYTPYLRCAVNQDRINDKVYFTNCCFSGWDYGFYGGYNLKVSSCSFYNNYYAINSGTSHTIDADVVSGYSAYYYGSAHTVYGYVCNTTYGGYVPNGYRLSVNFINNLYTLGWGAYNTFNGGKLVGNATVFRGGICNLFRWINVIGGANTNNTGSATEEQSCVFEDLSINSSDRYPIRVYTNAGNILPLASGDTDWQTPDSANAWILQAIPNSYCNYSTNINQIQYSPLNDMATYAPASSTTLTFKIWPVGWTTSLDQDDVVLEVKYFDTITGITRTTTYNTSQTYANGAWRECSVTFTPAQAGIVYFNLYLRSYESGAYVLIDPKWEVR